MRIAMIGHKKLPSRAGGIEVVVEELSTRMVKMGHTVDVYNRYTTKEWGKKDKDKKLRTYKGVNIIRIPTFNVSKLNAVVYTILATIRALFGRYDVIHYHAEGPCIMLWLTHLFRIKTVVTIHGLDWERAKWGKFAKWIIMSGEKQAVKYADQIIVLSHNMQTYFLETYNRQTTYIPNGISKPEKKELSIAKEKYNLEKEEYLLFLARIVPEKGLDYLIDAYMSIPTKKSLVIVGGSSHTDAYYEHIKRKVSKDHRIIMTGHIEGELLGELYSNAYLYILPSEIEGMPLSLLEAMSYGNCCLVSDISENTEVISGNGCTFEKSNVESLKNALIGLLNDSSKVKGWKGSASNYICKKYNWNNVVDSTLKIYAN